MGSVERSKDQRFLKKIEKSFYIFIITRYFRKLIGKNAIMREPYVITISNIFTKQKLQLIFRI